MQLIYEYEKADQSASLFKATRLSNDTRILVVEPISWAYLAGLFLTEFTKTLAHNLGEGFATAILQALGLIKGDSGNIEAYLEEMAQRMVREIRTIIYEDAVRSEHAKLAAAYQLFEEYLVSPGTRYSDIPALDAKVGEIYHQLRSLGVTALPAISGVCSLRMALKVERFRHTKDKNEGLVAKAAIEDSIKALKDSLSNLNQIYSQRVTGPFESTSTLQCRRFRSPEHPEGGHDVRLVKTLEYSIDGVWKETFLEGCHGLFDHAQADVAVLLANTRLSIETEFKRLYSDPGQIIELEGNNLIDELDNQMKLLQGETQASS